MKQQHVKYVVEKEKNLHPAPRYLITTMGSFCSIKIYISMERLIRFLSSN